MVPVTLLEAAREKISVSLFSLRQKVSHNAVSYAKQADGGNSTNLGRSKV